MATLRILIIVLAALVGLAGALGGTVLLAGGALVPARYLEPWSASYYRQFDDPRLQLVAHAVLAPSSHNMQPWRVELDPDDKSVFRLYADAARLTPAVDPVARQTLISQGTFLEYLRVAASELGYTVAVDIFPEGEYDESDLVHSMAAKPVARVTISAAPARVTPEYPALFESDTNRSPYAAGALSAAQLADLRETVAEPGASLAVLDDTQDRDALGAFGILGTRIEAAYAPSRAESDRLFYANEYSKNAARSGFAVEGQGTTGIAKLFLQGLITMIPAINDDASAETRDNAMTAAAVAATPAYAMISTAGNSRTEQVEAGMLYARFCLTARADGMVMQPLSQVLEEYPAMAAARSDVHRQYAPDGSTIQMIARVGVATVDYPQTMRRDIRDLIVTR
ncbi:nitroreductase family protein [soil metagenome]